MSKNQYTKNSENLKAENSPVDALNGPIAALNAPKLNEQEHLKQPKGSNDQPITGSIPDNHPERLSESAIPYGSISNNERRRAQRAKNLALQDMLDGYVMPSKVSIEDMVNEYVYVQKGELVAHVTENYTKILKASEHKKATASSFITYKDENGRSKIIYVHSQWMGSNHKVSATTLTFAAGRPPICSDPEGDRAVNTWRPIKRKYIDPKKLSENIKPFLEQVQYLFDDDARMFLDWLAHIEQKPEELPHFGFLHVAKNTGTGRNWLASVLCRVWKGYVSPNIELDKLIEGTFNSQLAGRVLAIVDEIQEGANDSYKAAQRLKSLVNSETRFINKKNVQQYYEFNSCRWLIFSNHLNAIPINDTDRRWHCVNMEKDRRSAEVYTHLYSLLENPDFINSVGVYLKTRNISSFNAGAIPPITKAKEKILNATKSEALKNAEEIVRRWPSDIITNKDIAEILSDGASTAMNAHFRNVLIEVDAIQIPRQIRVNGTGQKLWIIRNHQNWSMIADAGKNHLLQEEAYRAIKKNNADTSTGVINYSAKTILSLSDIL